MRIHYPGSFLKLLLIGFAFAILPLLWAFTNANMAFGKLAKQSERTISNAVETTRVSHTLQEQLSLMERSARQYHVLYDSALFDNYLQANTEFTESTTRLLAMTQDQAQRERVNTLKEQTQKLHKAILGSKNAAVDDLTFLNVFGRLNEHIENIIQQNNILIDNASNALTETVQQTQKNLFLQSLVLIPLTLLIAGVIAFLLARPIRRMDRAIRNLGEGYYDHPIKIDGPGDLRTLGKRLDWLRLELKDINEQKTQFLRHVSHELKTPLTAIREATELLHDGVGGTLSKQQTEIAEILKDNSLRLQKMIENLLSFTKFESLQPQSNLETVLLADVIQKVLEEHALSINSKQLIVETEIKMDQQIITDQEKLTIIFDNLISNAVKFTPASGHIKIIATEEKNWINIDFIDDGPGFSKEDFDKVFDPFYRGQAINEGLIKGSGLGLTIVKDLIENLGGSIKLKPSHLDLSKSSEMKPNQTKPGAHFTLILPNKID